MGARVFRHGELPLVVLAMLADRPMHAYELLGRISSTFESYSASPGSVYPAVSALEEQGLVHGNGDGRRTVYSVTPAGAAALAARQEALTALERRLGVEVAKRPVEQSLAELGERARSLEAVVGGDAVRRVIDDAVRRLDRLAERRARAGR